MYIRLGGRVYCFFERDISLKRLVSFPKATKTTVLQKLFRQSCCFVVF